MCSIKLSLPVPCCSAECCLLLQEKRLTVKELREHAWMTAPLPAKYSTALEELNTKQRVGVERLGGASHC